MTDREKVTAAAALVAKWRDRCLELAKQGKYWEAARLHEAANEMGAVLGPNPYSEPQPVKITTDDAIRDAYERVKRGEFQPVIWPNRPSPLYYPPLDTGTRITD